MLILAEDSLAFVPLYTLKYFHDFTDFNQIFIANFPQAINKPFATQVTWEGFHCNGLLDMLLCHTSHCDAFVSQL
jgi:hypothetical protein